MSDTTTVAVTLSEETNVVIPAVESTTVVATGTIGPRGPAGTGGSGSGLHADLTDLATSGHPASIIAVTPTGGVAATTVQAAIAELDTEKETPAGAQAKVDAHAAAGDPHPGYLTAAEGNAAYEPIGTVATHAGAADPHVGYQKESEKGAAGGYASLDGTGVVPDAQIPAAIARDAEVTTAVTNHESAANPHPTYLTQAEGDALYEDDGAVATHAAAADPHAGYQKESEKDQNNGYAGLDGSGLVPDARIAATIARDSEIPAFATPAIVLGSAAAAGSAGTVIRSDGTIVAFDATNPSTQAFGDAAAVGSAAFAARRDHKHAMPANPVTAHEAAGDPHTGYQKESEKGAASGYASLGADSLVPQDQLGTGTQDGTKFLRDDGTWQTPAGGGSGHVIKEDGTPRTQRAGLNFVNDAGNNLGVTFVATDDAGNDETEITASINGYPGRNIRDDGGDMTERGSLNFQDGFVLTDDSGGDETEIDLDYATTTEIADVGSTESAGTSPKVARGDHVHAGRVEVFMLAVSDELTTITTGTTKIAWRAPWAITVTAVRASLTTASSSGVVTVDINEGAGTGTSILSTKLTIDANEETSTTAATAAVISDTSLADDARITVDIDGAGTGAKGLKVYIYGTRT